MKLILIRHGETYSNTLFGSDKQILIGAMDNELTQLNEQGRRQAAAARERLSSMNLLHPDEIYTSDITRAMETAKIIFGEVPMIRDCRLRERDLGDFAGRLLKELEADEQAASFLVRYGEDSLEECLNKRAPQGENFIDVLARCKDFMSDFDVDSDKTIAVVSHFHTLKCMLYVLQNKEPDAQFFEMVIKNSCPILVELSQNEVSIREI